jgi:heme a synthase
MSSGAVRGREVSSEPGQPSSRRTDQRRIAVWLLICCALIFSMVVLGGVTRLTGSGLSIVEWEPIMGAVPPVTQADWEETFEQYRQTPEYRRVNFGMSLAEFKTIFWLEYAHRLLGRSIGLVFLVPLIYFVLRRKIERPLIPKLVVLFVLGGLQGALGWYMVKSGLVDNPHVSQYRLAAHLAAAFAIYGYMLWVALDLLWPGAARPDGAELRPLRRFALAVTALISLTVIAGAFVAGLKAGFAYNTFPLMAGRWIPDGLFVLEPVYSNFFENVTTVQFDHRLLALLVFALVVGLWLASKRYALYGRLRGAVSALVGVAALQVMLGISTLLLSVPIPLAAAHQAGALLLFTVALLVNHELRRPVR